MKALFNTEKIVARLQALFGTTGKENRFNYCIKHTMFSVLFRYPLFVDKLFTDTYEMVFDDELLYLGAAAAYAAIEKDRRYKTYLNKFDEYVKRIINGIEEVRG